VNDSIIIVEDDLSKSVISSFFGNNIKIVNFYDYIADNNSLEKIEKEKGELYE